MATITELGAHLEECEKNALNYSSNHVFAYEAEAQYLDNLLSELDEDAEEYDYDEYAWVSWLEGMLEDVISEVYDSWYQSENNIYCDSEGKWKDGASRQAWMVWALDSEVHAFHERMVEYAESEGLELPEWYISEYVD